MSWGGPTKWKRNQQCPFLGFSYLMDRVYLHYKTATSWQASKHIFISWRYNRFMRIYLVVVFCVVVLLLAPMWDMAHNDNEKNEVRGLSAVVGLILMIIPLKAFCRSYRKLTRMNKKEDEVAFFDMEGACVESPYIVARFPWSAVKEIRKKRNYYFLVYYGKTGVIPIPAFLLSPETRTAMIAILAQVQAKRNDLAVQPGRNPRVKEGIGDC